MKRWFSAIESEVEIETFMYVYIVCRCRCRCRCRCISPKMMMPRLLEWMED
jgi:hypothetical protein